MGAMAPSPPGSATAVHIYVSSPTEIFLTCRAHSHMDISYDGALTYYLAKFSWKLYENEENWA